MGQLRAGRSVERASSSLAEALPISFVCRVAARVPATRRWGNRQAYTVRTPAHRVETRCSCQLRLEMRLENLGVPPPSCLPRVYLAGASATGSRRIRLHEVLLVAPPCLKKASLLPL